jgi:hypothetical protein
MKVYSRSRRSDSHLGSSSNLLTVLFCLALLPIAVVQATITVIDTGKRFASHQDHSLGKRLWKGYEYMARLQYINGNLQLCPSEHGQNHTYKLLVPEDGLPVALLVRAGGCSLDAKADFVLKNVSPPGLVKYLIVDGSRRADTVYFPAEEYDFQEQRSRLEEQRQVLTLQEPASEKEKIKTELASYVDKRRKHPDATDEEIPLYMIHVSYNTEFALLDMFLKQEPEIIAAGGPRITIDSRLGTGDLNSTAILWIAISALLGACACSMLLFSHGTNGQGGWFYEEPTHRPPPRPTRRRLTHEQVKRLLPRYHFDGHCLQVMGEEAKESQENDGLISAEAAPAPPTPLDLELCSICLDEYEAGDRLRCLPCNHVFHSKCIGRWLSERSATCPLCKTDLWEEEEEVDQEEEASLVRANEGGTQEPNMEVQSWLDQLFGLNVERNPETGQPVEATVTTAPPQEVTREDTEVSSGSPWWRRMFLARQRASGRPAAVDESAAASLAEPLLQQGDEEAPSAELVRTSSAETPQEQEASEEQTEPDLPETHRNRQVSV